MIPHKLSHLSHRHDIYNSFFSSLKPLTLLNLKSFSIYIGQIWPGTASMHQNLKYRILLSETRCIITWRSVPEDFEPQSIFHHCVHGRSCTTCLSAGKYFSLCTLSHLVCTYVRQMWTHLISKKKNCCFCDRFVSKLRQWELATLRFQPGPKCLPLMVAAKSCAWPTRLLFYSRP